VPQQSRLTRSAEPRLAVVLNGMLAGRVYQSGNRRLAFQYVDGWRGQPAAYPLSLSMPLEHQEHGHQATSAYLWGLLPDDQRVIAYWSRTYGVPGTDVVQLLAHVGEECAGAVQLVPPADTERVLGASNSDDERTSVDWLTMDQVGHRLQALRNNPAATRTADDRGQFSLAGAQPKTTLYWANGRWGVPRGRVPSTHILKPPVMDLDDLAYNEHLCLLLARDVGLLAAHSEVRSFGVESAIVVERYDRVRANGITRRVHQEDLCQALAVQPTRKYETDGGPSLLAICRLLAQYSSEPDVDVARFIEANVFNWLIAGSDAHAKNYSVLHAPRELRLAPLYDVISTLPYPQLGLGGMQLAMAVDGERHVDVITGKHWRAVARAAELPEDALIARIEELGERLSMAIERRVADPALDPETRAVAERLTSPIAQHVARCLARL
jgi:serine/threonine-protein kinase HipA